MTTLTRIFAAFGLFCFLAIIAVAIFAPFEVEPGEEALILNRDGAVVYRVGPGSHYRIPLLQSVDIEKTLEQRLVQTSVIGRADRCAYDISMVWNIVDLVQFRQTLGQDAERAESRIAALAADKARNLPVTTADVLDAALRVDDFWRFTGINLIRTMVTRRDCQ